MSHSRRASMPLCGYVLAGLLTAFAAFPAQAKTIGTVFAHHAHARPGKPREIPVLSLDAPTPHPTRVLGVIYMMSSGPVGLVSPDAEYWADRFRAEAVKLGADAVVGVNTLHFAEQAKYELEGLAVEYRDEGSPPDSCDCVLSIAPPTLDYDLPDHWRAQIAHDLPLAVQERLAGKGRYAIVSTDSLGPGAGVSPPMVPALGRTADGWFTLRVSEAAPTDSRAGSQRGSQQVTQPEPTYLPELADMRAAMESSAGDTTWSASETRSSKLLPYLPQGVFTSRKLPQNRLGQFARELIDRMPSPKRSLTAPPR